MTNPQGISLTTWTNKLEVFTYVKIGYMLISSLLRINEHFGDLCGNVLSLRDVILVRVLFCCFAHQIYHRTQDDTAFEPTEVHSHIYYKMYFSYL